MPATRSCYSGPIKDEILKTYTIGKYKYHDIKTYNACIGKYDYYTWKEWIYADYIFYSLLFLFAILIILVLKSFSDALH